MPIKAVYDKAEATISIFRQGSQEPLVVQHARSNFRPYIHPIIAPDGQGALTQFSPGHHPHQTGLYFGLTRVNGRDYFHNPGGDYWQRLSADVKEPVQSSRDSAAGNLNQVVGWQTVYNLLDEDDQTILTETQDWEMYERNGTFILDLKWQGKAKMDVTISKYDYGGLFLRMPWSEGVHAEAVNSEGERNQQAEGNRAKWLDLGMQVEGRNDLAHIAIFDHSGNKGFPATWRVDGQMGVGAALTRMEDWILNKGETAAICYRFKIYTGEFKDLQTDWTNFVEESPGCPE